MGGERERGRGRKREKEGDGRESSLSNGTCTRDRECDCDMRWDKDRRSTEQLSGSGGSRAKRGCQATITVSCPWRLVASLQRRVTSRDATALDRRGCHWGERPGDPACNSVALPSSPLLPPAVLPDTGIRRDKSIYRSELNAHIQTRYVSEHTRLTFRSSSCAGTQPPIRIAYSGVF